MTGNVSLSACPGSGKTRVIVAKLLRCVGALEGSMRRAGCITYTNAGVAEIEVKIAPTRRFYGGCVC